MIQWLINLFREDREFGALRSGQWETLRSSFLKESPKCAVCESKKDLEVHHVKPFHLHPELELDKNNLITLCAVHHLWFGHLGSWKSYSLTVRSDSDWFRVKIKSRP